ncbi:MAG TPA: radical SAM protein [Polyangiaceae bacterium]|nr:radical SAM protein [Polyangiaceae bacterium]
MKTANSSSEPADSCEPEGRRPSLFSAAIELTGACNQKCAYCYNEWRGDSGASISTGGRDKVLARIRRLLDTFDVRELTLTGGEPFTRPDLFEILDLIRSRGVAAHIISNGGLIDEERARALAEREVRFVQVTLNGAERELHEEHVGLGHFDATLEGIRALRAADVEVVGCIVVTRKNANHVADILELFDSLRVRHIALSRFSPAGYATRHVADLLPSRADLIAALSRAAPFVKARGMSIRVTMPIPPCAVEIEQFPDLIFGVCPVGTPQQEFAIGPDGALRHCTLHREKLGGGLDIADPSLDLVKLVRGSEVSQYRATVPEFCRGCLHEKTCAGGCGAAAEWVLGSRNHPDPIVAQHVDEAFGSELERLREPQRVRLNVLHASDDGCRHGAADYSGA